MRRFRAVAAAATASILVGAVASMGGAGAAAPVGVGTGRASTSVLKVSVGAGGALLDVRLLGDDSQSVIDTLVAGAPSAYTRLAPLDVASQTVPALNLSVPGVESKSPGGAPAVGAPAVPLSTPVASGTIDPASLSASVDATGAKSALSSAITDLGLVGDLVHLKGARSSLSSDALTSASDGVRGLVIDQLTALKLGSLLELLGIKLSDLPVSTISALLSQLKVPVPGLTNGVSLQSAVSSLDQAISQVQALLTTAGTTVDSTVNGTVTSIVGTVGGLLGGVTGTGAPPVALPPVPSVGSAISTLNATLDGLKKNLSDLLGGSLTTLDNVALLSANGIQVGLTAKAADTVGNSVAGVTAKIGSVSVGGLGIPGVDLGATATQLTALINSVTANVSAVLGKVDPGLANLVSIKLLDQGRSVSASGGYTHALANVTVLKAALTPPANLTAIVSGIKSLPGVGSVIGGLGGQLPALSSAVSTLQSALGGVTSVLAGGATVTVGELTSSADFAPKAGAAPAAPAPTGSELPRTGGDNAPFAVLGVLMMAMSLGLVRWLRRPLTD